MATARDGTPRSLAAAGTASRYCALLLLALILLSSLGKGVAGDQGGSSSSSNVYHHHRAAGGSWFLTGAAGKPCDEIYIVGEGETLHTISDKCKDPFIIERNPHIQDPDDVFPGLVIKIVPLAPGQTGN